MQSKFYILHQNPNSLRFDHLYRNSAQLQRGTFLQTLHLNFMPWEDVNSHFLQPCKEKKWLWLLCLEVYVLLQEGFAEEQNLFHCVAGGRKYLWSVPVLI